MEPSDDRRIVPLSDVPEDGTLLFTVREGFDEREVVLVRLADGEEVAAWKNYSSARTHRNSPGGRTARP
jgi:hypothetical protein